MIGLDRKHFDKLLLNFSGTHQIRDINDDNSEWDFFTHYGGNKVMVFKVNILGTSDRIMDGDIVLTSRGLRRVSITGYSGSYIYRDGFAINVAMGDEGYLYNALHDNPHTDDHYRATWTKLKVVKRAQPSLWDETGLIR